MKDKPAVKSFSIEEVNEDNNNNNINRKCIGDMAVFYTSSLNEDMIPELCETDGRITGRQEVITHFDELLNRKISKELDFEHIEEELNRISQERQNERNAFMARRNKNNRRVKNDSSRFDRNKNDADISLEERTETPTEAKPEIPEVKEVVTETPVYTEPASEVPVMTEAADETRTKAESAPDRKLDTLIDSIFTGFRKVSNDMVCMAAAALSAAYGRLDGLSSASVKEAKISGCCAGLIDKLDLLNDKIADKLSKICSACLNKWIRSKEWAERHKRLLLSIFAGCVVTAAGAAIIIGNITCYEYLYNGKLLGTVKDIQVVYKTIDLIGDKLSYVYGAEIEIDKEEDIAFRKVYGWNKDIDDKDDVLNTLTYLQDMNANAYAIYADGKRLAVLNSKKDAEGILQTVKNNFIKQSDLIEYKSIDFAEDVEIREIETKIGSIDHNEDELLEYMLTGALEKKIHVVKSGETFLQIAKDYGLKSKELQASNPDVTPDKLQIGQELVLTQVCPVLTVQTKEIATYTAKIDYDITYQETSTLYQGEQTVKSYGIPGERQVVAEIVRNNGTEVSRIELSSEVVKDPVSQVVLKGTKELPPLIGTGTFIYPARGKLTSRFGPRWGRMHYGIDIAAPSGTKIRASDGGTVIYAGWDGSYGYVVRIDHGGNRTTVYAHCSKLLVKRGDKVYQDQHIANVGNTGRSTGSHVHFEVRINGVAKNPLSYLN